MKRGRESKIKSPVFERESFAFVEPVDPVYKMKVPCGGKLTNAVPTDRVELVDPVEVIYPTSTIVLQFFFKEQLSPHSIQLAISLCNVLISINELDHRVGGAGYEIKSHRHQRHKKATATFSLVPQKSPGNDNRVRRISHLLTNVDKIRLPPEVKRISARLE